MRRPDWYDYDSALQMIREAPREPDHRHLLYLKYLVDTGRFDDDTAPAYALPPSGQPEYAGKL